LLLFRASADAIVAQQELTAPFGTLTVPMRVLRGSHSGCVQDLGTPGDENFEMIVHWIEKHTGRSWQERDLRQPQPPTQVTVPGAANVRSLPTMAAVVDAYEPPPIHVVTTTDGVRIAHWVMGTGSPLVILPAALPFSNVELELEDGLTKGWYERLARFCQPARYDARGTGHSDTTAADLTINGYLLDVDAVARQITDQKVALFGAFHAGPIAIAYAAAYPEKVSHLILWCSYAEASDFWADADIQSMNGLLRTNWRNYTENIAANAFGWHDHQTRSRMARFLRNSTGQQAVIEAIAAIERFDATGLLKDVRVPTLILVGR
jgi:pimeloyl-ACP methyl ester carboxylesterase